MTIVAALALEDRVIMGCDIRTDYSGTGILTEDSKIGTLRAPNGDKILVAASGNASLRPVVLRSLKVEGTPDPSDREAADQWADAVAAAITDLLVDAKPSVVTSAGDDASALDGTFILAWRQHLWWIFTHTAVRPIDGILAIGSGTEVALGSLHTAAEAGMNTLTAVDLAVRLACRHASGCGIDERGPIIVSTVVDDA